MWNRTVPVLKAKIVRLVLAAALFLCACCDHASAVAFKRVGGEKSCTDEAGWDYIRGWTACERAAKALSLGKQSVQQVHQTDYSPPGCTYDTSDWKLVFNPPTSATSPEKCEDDKVCICTSLSDCDSIDSI